MGNKNLFELSERELENKAKLLKNSFYFMAITGLVCTAIVLISAYWSKQPVGWTSLIFTTFFPLFLVFQIRKQQNEVKAEFVRRRYR
jgi:Flp pilus assembly protein TadB